MNNRSKYEIKLNLVSRFTIYVYVDDMFHHTKTSSNVTCTSEEAIVCSYRRQLFYFVSKFSIS